MPNHILINKKITQFKKKIEVSSDKSLSIRSVLLASIAVGVSKISNLLESEDVLNSLKTIKKLGINYRKKENIYEIYGFGINGFNLKKNTVINAGNSGTLARLILGLLVKSNVKIKLIGDRSLSRRDFSRVTEPLKFFGANIKSKKNSLPVEIQGTEFLRPIDYLEEKGSAQCKSSVMLAALNAPGITKIKAKKSRNHTEILFKHLNIPTKIKSEGNYDLIDVRGLSQFKSFNYEIPGDPSSTKGNNARGIYWTKPDHTGKEIPRDKLIDESAYTEFVKDFEKTYFKKVYNELSKKFKLGRVRILLKEPRSTLSWHRDPEPRLHVPIITNPGCIMVIENVAKHLPADGSVYITNNLKYHNAFNGGEENRVHLVACLPDYKFN